MSPSASVGRFKRSGTDIARLEFTVGSAALEPTYLTLTH
jgi:hypothetical protein